MLRTPVVGAGHDRPATRTEVHGAGLSQPHRCLVADDCVHFGGIDDLRKMFERKIGRARHDAACVPVEFDKRRSCRDLVLGGQKHRPARSSLRRP